MLVRPVLTESGACACVAPQGRAQAQRIRARRPCGAHLTARQGSCLGHLSALYLGIESCIPCVVSYDASTYRYPYIIRTESLALNRRNTYGDYVDGSQSIFSLQFCRQTHSLSLQQLPHSFTRVLDGFARMMWS
eukprot:2747850-Pleurochrysis_carterae.AAC.2